MKRKDENEALKEILNACERNGCDFIGFVEGKWETTHGTHLILKCKKCGNIWNTSTYNSFVEHNRKCIKCYGKRKHTDEYLNDTISKLCNERDIEFLGFKDDEYKNINTYLILKCKKCGKIWDTTTYNNFVTKNRKCPYCRKWKLEEDVENFLINENIEYETRKFYPWLKTSKHTLQLDFFLPKYNVAIECQGIQHFKPVDFSNKMTKEEMEKTFSIVQKNDEFKRKKCEELGIKLLYYSNVKNMNFPYDVYTDLNELKIILCK